VKPVRRAPPETGLVERRELLDAAGIAAVLERLAAELLARHPGARDLALVGVHTGGYVLAQRLQKLLGASVPLGAVDITLYRDDVFEGLPRPEVGATELPFALPGRVIVLVDDVLYTGRTVRAALDALNDYGRPRAVELAVLVDRGHRELPIQADYVGLRVETARRESVRVELAELGEVDRVVVREKVAP
jgi:pyrimidine operon attenuation protein/uracil phosphoribosyltransferase